MFKIETEMFLFQTFCRCPVIFPPPKNVSGGREYFLPPARIFSPPGENILAEGREYSLPPRVEILPSIDREKVCLHDTKDVLK